DARRDGYRACRRCRPDSAQGNGAANAVARARAHLDRFAGERTIALAELADVAGVSPFHLQRSFKRFVGISPRDYQEALRTDRLRARLRAGATVSRATFDAGYG